MVSVKAPKAAKASYADRVMGAITQLQREHKRRAIHPATLRAQVKKNAQEKDDRLGPNWSHWEAEGIIEPSTPKGSVTLTSKGKKAVDYARRSIRKSIGGLPGQNEDDLVWKGVTNYSTLKRPRRSSVHEQYTFDDDDAYHTPSRSATSKKRVRLSVNPSVRKSAFRTKTTERNSGLVTKKAQVPSFERESLSPLTDLESDDEGVTANLLEELRRENENMRRELAAARETGPVEGSLFDNTPINVDNPFSMPGDDGFLSRKRLGVTERPPSGSVLLNHSRLPTPTSSLPDNNDDFCPRGMPYNDVHLVPNHAAATAALENAMSNRVRELEQTVTEHDATIDALRRESDASKTELAVLQDSWKRANETVTETRDQLATSEALLEKVQTERENEARKVSSLENANTDLARSTEILRVSLEQVNTEYTDIKTAYELLRSENSGIFTQLDAMKGAKIQLEDALAKASDESQEFVRKIGELELSITKYQSEVEKKQQTCQQLEARIREIELDHEGTVARFLEAESEGSAQLSRASAEITSLTASLTHMGTETEALRISLTRATEGLKAEESKTHELQTQLDEKDRELSTAHGVVVEGRQSIENLQAEITRKEDTISRLSTENDGVQLELSAVKAAMIDLKYSQEAEHFVSLQRISEIEASLSSANVENAKQKEQMTAVREENGKLQENLSQSTLTVNDLQNCLDMEQTNKLDVLADLRASNARAQELETELRDLKNCKKNDDQTIHTLKGYFADLRGAQAKLFEGMGAKIDTISPSSLLQS